VVEFAGVAKWFQPEDGPRVVALDGIDLRVRRDRFVSVVGPSGCGKSTLLNLCAGLSFPEVGRVMFRGSPVTRVNTEVGYVTQDSNLLPWRSATTPKAAAAPGSPQPLQTVKIGLAVNILAFTPLQIATMQGYFRHGDIAPDVVSLQGGTTVTEALMGGSLQFAASAAPDVIRADQKGLGLLAVANILNANDVELVISKKLQQQFGISASTPLKQRLAPLQGRLFGITSNGAPSQVDIQALFKSVGLNAQSLHFIVIGGAAEMNAALRAGEIAGYGLGPPTGELAAREGYGYVLVPVGGAPAFANQAFSDIYTTNAFAQAHPAVVRAVAGAIAQANDFLLSHPNQSARLLSPSFKGVPLSVLAAGIRAEPFVRGGTFTQQGWQRAIAALQQGGVLPGKAPSSQAGVLWTNQYVAPAST
jgi:ABC-type nitrate/sulfonate/bicarbonate transport system substrate-binding protein